MILKDFRKSKIGIVNFMMLGNAGKETEDLALKSVDNSIKYLESLGVEAVSPLPAVGSLEDARLVVKEFKKNDVDAMVIFGGTFTLGFPIAEVVRNTDLPMLVWAFEESRLIEDGLPAGSLTGLMPAGTIMRNMGKRHSFVLGDAGNEEVKIKVKLFTDAVRAITYMRTATIGLFGARPDGFELSDFDELSIKSIFGTTISKVSMSELLDTIDSIDESDVEKDLKIQYDIFDTKKCTTDELKGISRVYLGVKKVVDKYKLQAFTPQCWPELRMERKTPICPANGRITSEGIMASCEADMDCALTMLLLHSLNGNTPWTLDLITFNKEKDSLLFWHCGNASHTLSEKKPVIEVVFEGPAQTATMKSGKVTICRVNHFKGGFEIFAGKGESIGADSKLRGSSMFVKMENGKEFINIMQEKGIPHHVVIIYGDLSKELKEVANLIGLPLTII